MGNITKDTRVSLTRSTISESMYKIIDRLQKGRSVDMSDIMMTPEVRLAEQVMDNISVRDTSKADPAVRADLRAGIVRDMKYIGAYSGRGADGKPKYEGEPAFGKQLHIVVGLPASGKSSGLADVISENFNAKLLDNDMIKEMIPEYAGGWGSGAVHNESKMISDRVMQNEMAAGTNLVIPKLGHPVDSLESILKMAEQNGYTVNVHMMDVEPNKALGRLMSRFIEDGRYINPVWMDQFVKDPELMARSFDELKQDERVSGYTIWTNNVDYGEKPILKEWSDNFEATDFIDNGRKDIENEKLSKSESNIEVLAGKLDIKDAIIHDTLRVDNAEKNRRAAEITANIRFGQTINEMQDNLLAIQEGRVSDVKPLSDTARSVDPEKSDLQKSLEKQIQANVKNAKGSDDMQAGKQVGE